MLISSANKKELNLESLRHHRKSHGLLKDRVLRNTPREGAVELRKLMRVTHFLRCFVRNFYNDR